MKPRQAGFVSSCALQLHSPVFYFVASCIASLFFSLIIVGSKQVSLFVKSFELRCTVTCYKKIRSDWG